MWQLDLDPVLWSRVSDGIHPAAFPSWSPDGEWLYYTRWPLDTEPIESGGLYVYDRVLRVTHQLVSREGVPIWPAARVTFSPDGNWMAFPSAVPGPDPAVASVFELVVIRRDGTGPRQLTEMGGQVGSPQWLPDGRSIEFDFVQNECLELGYSPRHTWSVGTDGSDLHRWSYDLNDPLVEGYPPPSIDRVHRRVAYVGTVSGVGPGSLYVMQIDGRIVRRLFPISR